MFLSLVVNLVIFSTFTANFERKVIEKNFTETTKGVVYCQKNLSKVIIEVNEPIKQVIVVNEKVTEIYYPEEQKAFRIKSKYPTPLPLIQGIVTAIKAAEGLREMGYKLTSHKKKEQILYTYWEPPQKLKKLFGIIVVGMKDGKVVYTETRNPKGEIISKSFYKDYIRFEKLWLPSRIYSETYKGSGVTKEHIVYSNFTHHIPERILNFSIPPSVPVKEIIWEAGK